MVKYSLYKNENETRYKKQAIVHATKPYIWIKSSGRSRMTFHGVLPDNIFHASAVGEAPYFLCVSCWPWQSERESLRLLWFLSTLGGGTTINTSHLLKLGAGPLGPILDLPLDLMQVEGLAAWGSYLVLILIFGTIIIRLFPGFEEMNVGGTVKMHLLSDVYIRHPPDVQYIYIYQTSNIYIIHLTHANVWQWMGKPCSCK